MLLSGVEQLFLGRHPVAAARPPVRFAAAARRHELHQAVGRRRAHRERIEVALGADDGEHQALAHLVLRGGLRYAGAEFLGLLVGEVRDHRDLHEQRFLRRRRRSAHAAGRRLAREQVVGEGLGFGRLRRSRARADRAPGP